MTKPVDISAEPRQIIIEGHEYTEAFYTRANISDWMCVSRTACNICRRYLQSGGGNDSTVPGTLFCANRCEEAKVYDCASPVTQARVEAWHEFAAHRLGQRRRETARREARRADRAMIQEIVEGFDHAE